MMGWTLLIEVGTLEVARGSTRFAVSCSRLVLGICVLDVPTWLRAVMSVVVAEASYTQRPAWFYC